MSRKTGFGERLQRIMTEKGLTQSDLARKLWGTMTDERGYTVAKNRQNLGKYLAGENEPRLSTMRKMAEVLGVPISALDPSSDPLNRAGSGLHVQYLDAQRARLEVSLVAPHDIVHQAVRLLSQYAT
jgi:transcriptional regulator with XRE-family HTH domain